MIEKQKRKTIKLKWIEAGAGKKTKIALTAEIENDELKLISAKCFPGIICLTCGPAFSPPCTQLAAR